MRIPEASLKGRQSSHSFRKDHLKGLSWGPLGGPAVEILDTGGRVQSLGQRTKILMPQLRPGADE